MLQVAGRALPGLLQDEAAGPEGGGAAGSSQSGSKPETGNSLGSASGSGQSALDLEVEAEIVPSASRGASGIRGEELGNVLPAPVVAGCAGDRDERHLSQPIRARTPQRPCHCPTLREPPAQRTDQAEPQNSLEWRDSAWGRAIVGFLDRESNTECIFGEIRAEYGYAEAPLKAFRGMDEYGCGPRSRLSM